MSHFSKGYEMAKTHTLVLKYSKIQGSKEPSEVSGTLEELQKHFNYVFEIGHSYKKKINPRPKTIKSFVNNLQKSYEEKEAYCLNRTSVFLKEEQTSDK